ncbi:hypothetical protein Tco_0758002 [Tanacetum coccineum]
MEADGRPRHEPRNQSVALSPLTKTRLEHYFGVEIFSKIVAHFADYFVAEEFVVEGVAVAVAEVVLDEAVAAEIVAEVIFASVKVEAGMVLML